MSITTSVHIGLPRRAQSTLLFGIEDILALILPVFSMPKQTEFVTILTPRKDSVYLKPDFLQSCKVLKLQVVAGATILFSLLLIFLSLLLLCFSHVEPIVPSFALIDFTSEFLLVPMLLIVSLFVLTCADDQLSEL